MNINVFIERLILDGLPIDRTQGPLIHAAVETELRRLLAQQGMSHASGGAVPYLSAHSIHIAQDSKPAQIGNQIAGAVHGSLAPVSSLRHEAHLPGGSH
jgi:hypothetical protein